MTQSERYERFRELHEREGGFIMPNAWDGMSALLLKQAGFEALGTSSAAIASTLGRLDGRHAVSREEHLANAQLLEKLTDLPINGDFEDGYGATAADVAATVRVAIERGLAGIGIEDTTGNPENPIREFDDAVSRVREAAKVSKGRIMLTGRTDNFLQGRPDLDDTIRRLVAFAEVGADVLYAPYPTDMNAVRAIVKAVAPKPVNVLMSRANPALSVARLTDLGVRRISVGSAMARVAWGAFIRAARDIAETGSFDAFAEAAPFSELDGVFAIRRIF